MQATVFCATTLAGTRRRHRGAKFRASGLVVIGHGKAFREPVKYLGLGNNQAQISDLCYLLASGTKRPYNAPSGIIVVDLRSIFMPDLLAWVLGPGSAEKSPKAAKN